MNLGNTLSLWTGSRWEAPVHRVVNSKTPEAEANEGADTTNTSPRINIGDWFQLQHTDADCMSSRQCIAYFMHPNYDVVISPLLPEDSANSASDQRAAASDADHQPPITAGELAMRSARRFTLVGTEHSENQRAGRFRASR